MTGKDAVLDAFDHLFDKAASKLDVACSPEEKNDARRDFAERMSAALELMSQIDMPGIPAEVLRQMEDAIDRLSPAQLCGYLAALPLAHQAQEVMRHLTYRAAEQRLLEHYAGQADDRYGGN